jgi:hypothetical protein
MYEALVVRILTCARYMVAYAIALVPLALLSTATGLLVYLVWNSVRVLHALHAIIFHLDRLLDAASMNWLPSINSLNLMTNREFAAVVWCCTWLPWSLLRGVETLLRTVCWAVSEVPFLVMGVLLLGGALTIWQVWPAIRVHHRAWKEDRLAFERALYESVLLREVQQTCLCDPLVNIVAGYLFVKPKSN